MDQFPPKTLTPPSSKEFFCYNTESKENRAQDDPIIRSIKGALRSLKKSLFHFRARNQSTSSDSSNHHRFCFSSPTPVPLAAAIARRPDPEEIVGRPSSDPQGRVCGGFAARGVVDGRRPLVRPVLSQRVRFRRGWKSLAGLLQLRRGGAPQSLRPRSNP